MKQFPPLEQLMPYQSIGLLIGYEIYLFEWHIYLIASPHEKPLCSAMHGELSRLRCVAAVF